MVHQLLAQTLWKAFIQNHVHRSSFNRNLSSLHDLSNLLE
jgi:hypothetical protein